MSGYPIETRAQTATLEDCERLFRTLRDDYIPGLKIEMRVELIDPRIATLVLELVDYSTITIPELGPRSVWAVRRFRNGLHLITCGALFDLLIVGYRVIDAFFTTGVDNRPRPVKG